MADDPLQAVRQTLDILRATYLRRLADEDPTFTRLREALVEEQRIQQMDTRAFLDFLTALEARVSRDA